LRRAVELRWREHLAYLAGLDEVWALFGEPLIHADLADLLQKIERAILDLYEGLCRRGERFPLPERDEKSIDVVRSWIRWDDLRDPGIAGPDGGSAQSWIPPHMQKELDELEARLAEEVRAGKH
jgi:hypothetical protein